MLVSKKWTYKFLFRDAPKHLGYKVIVSPLSYNHYVTFIVSVTVFNTKSVFATIFVKSEIKRLCKTVNIGVGSLFIYSNNINANCVPLTVRFSSFIQPMRNRGYKMTHDSPLIAMVDAIISIKNLPWPIKSYLIHSLT